MKLKIIIHPAEEGGFWAEVPALPGCYSQGETLPELKANIKEAIEGWLIVTSEVAGEAVVEPARVEEVEV